MVDVMLMRALMMAVPDEGCTADRRRCRPAASVGPGQALADIITSGVVPVVRLTEVFRPGGAEPDRDLRARGSTGGPYPISPGRRRTATSTSCPRTIRRLRRGGSSSW